VLIVDDSAYVRKVIKQMLSRSPFIEVVGAARDGAEALEMVQELRPDVMTVDLIMPGMGGLGFIRQQMARAPIPIVVVSIASETSQLVLDALDAGAIDFVQKPSALASEKVFEMSDELVAKVKMAGTVELGRSRIPEPTPPLPSKPSANSKVQIVVIGVSTGGPRALKYLIPRFPADFPVPIAVVIHMPAGYTELYAKRLDEISPLQVQEAQEGMRILKGSVLIAPAGRHLTFNRAGTQVLAHLDARPLDALYRPSVDVLFRSAADTYGSGVLGVVMTGMGEDGKTGTEMIKAKGGFAIAEAEQSCTVFGMPRVVIEAGLANRVVPLDRMAEEISEVVHGQDSHS
jgi:two-component system chemotaxis response regulator CheB